MNRPKKPPSAAWFNALWTWSLHEQDLPAALRVRDRELVIVAGFGRLAYESYCCIEQCQLLAQLGRPLGEELAAARAAARLRDPAPELDKLERAARGETGGA